MEHCKEHYRVLELHYKLETMWTFAGLEEGSKPFLDANLNRTLVVLENRSVVSAMKCAYLP